MTLLAHVGHWAVNLLFVLPVLVIVGMIVMDRIRHGKDGPDPDDAAAVPGWEPDPSGRD